MLFRSVTRETFDIVAQCDGTIQSIELIQGTLLKNIGDSFKKGDIIVKGEFTSMQGNLEKCRAEANITYIESHFLYTEFKEVETVLERTGKKIEYKTINFFDLTSKKEEICPYEYYESEKKESQIFNNFFLPITQVIKTFYEMKFVEKVRNFEEESIKIISKNEKELKEKYIESNILDLFSTSVKTNEGYLITTTIQIINTM